MSAVCFILSLLFSATCGMINTLHAERKVEFDNIVYLTNTLSEFKAISLVTCTAKCESFERCMSFVFIREVEECILYWVAFLSENVNSSKIVDGARYYVAGNKEKCPLQNGFLHFRSTGSCHKLVWDAVYGFDQDETYCSSYGGHLSKFDDVPEHRAVADVILASEDYRDRGFLTGAYRDGPGNSWVWRDGTSASNPGFWRIMEPSGDGKCAYMCANPECQFNDFPCHAYKFICEIDL